MGIICQLETPQTPELTSVSSPESLGKLERLSLSLPESHVPYTDKYFLRSNQVLKNEDLNPFVRCQVFIRKGPGNAFGIDEALAIIQRYGGKLIENGGRVWALEEGAKYDPMESLLMIEGRAQDIMELETMYLGVLSAETTKFNEGIEHVNLEQVTENMQKIRDLVGDRPVIYMGARHWTFREDEQIGKAAIEGGATGTSTNIGSKTISEEGVGTIPHALENIMAWYYGKENAVKESTLAFDRAIDPRVPRIALIDYNNKEIDDSLRTARALGDRLFAIRVDTCGENLGQGAYQSIEDVPANSPLRQAYFQAPIENRQYWFGKGVTVSGVFALKTALDQEDFRQLRFVLSSGFADINKIRAFLNAEEIFKQKLFDILGVGGLYKPCREAKMDIVAVADSLEKLDTSPMSKVGREYRPNERLKLVLGKLQN